MNQNDVLQDVADILSTRQESYGDSDEMLKRIADLWSVLFRIEVTPGDVAKAMALLKIARSLIGENDKTRDDMLDAIGYLALGISSEDNWISKFGF